MSYYEDNNLKREMCIMLKKVLIRFGFGVAGFIMTKAAIDKFENASDKHDTKLTIELKSKKDEEEITEEDVQEALATELKIVK
jgi:hypothetical protein